MNAPSHWCIKQLSEIAEIVRGSSPRPAGDPRFFSGQFLPWITVSEITKDASMHLRTTEFSLTEEGAKHTRIFEPGTLLLTNSGATLGVPKITAIRAGANDGVAGFLQLKQDTRFVYHFLTSKTPYFRGGLAPGVGQPNLNTELIGSVAISLPPLPEQQKIADILGTWDEALEKLDALIAAKERRKLALLQRLLTGQSRLPGFDQSEGRKIKNRHGEYPSDWSRVRLADITMESSVRADSTTGGIVLSCTKHHGLVPSEEYFGKRVYAADTSAYKVARRGEFAYATNHIEEGSIGYQNICDVGLVSPIYTVFKSNDAVDDSYFYRLLKSSLMIHLYRVNTSASVDRRGSLRYGEFAEIKINLPSKLEQRAIAGVLDTVDAELRLLLDQRAAVDQQKRGLMQQLLTGKIRVTT